MSRNGKQSRRNRFALQWLIRRAGWRCERCRAGVIEAHVAQARGWAIDSPRGECVSPAGRRVRIATVEHVVRLADGGPHARPNLRLFCEPCNRHENFRALGLLETRA